MKRAIVIQGPSSNVEELKKAWDGYDLIWSTWIGEESKYEENDIVVYNTVPNDSGVGNISLQKETTLNGVKKAKELGYDRVFKWRSDMIPTNANSLLSLLSENLNILFYHNTLPIKEGYYVDYVIETDIDTMEKIWSFEELQADFAERIITSNIKNNNITNIHLFGGRLTPENDILWVKQNIRISSYKLHKPYEYNEF